MLCDEQLPWSKEVRPNAFFFGYSDNHPNPPPLHCVTVNVQQYIFGNVVVHPCATWRSFIFIWVRGQMQMRLSIFKVASASKYNKCQWSSTKDKEDTIYRKFISLCLFVWFFRSRRMRSQRYWAKTTNCTRQQGDKWCMALADQYILGR